LADPLLTVLDASGQAIASDDDDSGPGHDARLRFTPATDGLYYVQASSSDGGLGGYHIAIRAVATE
jgi:hypothetical protein